MRLTIEKKLHDWQQADLVRHRVVSEQRNGVVAIISGQKKLNFSSNDYLGLSQHPRVINALVDAARRVGVGATASPAVAGLTDDHEKLEQALATFMGYDSALLFPCGYMANIGIINALVSEDSVILQDKLNHASLLDAGRLSGGNMFRYPHASMKRLDNFLQKYQDKPKLVITEGVFSVDGDVAPLPELTRLADDANTLTYLDDAHAFGVLGDNGRGTLSHYGLSSKHINVLVGTFGKAFGTSGAFVLASQKIIEAIRQFSRTYMFSTALPPAMAAASLMSLEIIQQGELQRALQKNIQLFHQFAQAHRIPCMPKAKAAIQPIIIGAANKAYLLQKALLKAGFLVGCMRPPTVPKGTSRLRIVLSALHTEAMILALVKALAHYLQDTHYAVETSL